LHLYTHIHIYIGIAKVMGIREENMKREKKGLGASGSKHAYILRATLYTLFIAFSDLFPQQRLQLLFHFGIYLVYVPARIDPNNLA